MPENGEPTPEEWAAIEAADAYLDAVSSGLDLSGDPLGATELQRDIDREPLAWPNFPSAHTASGNPPPAATTGGTVSTTEENAAAVRALAAQLPMAPMQAVLDALSSISGSIGAYLGNVPGANKAQGQFNAVIEVGDELMGRIRGLEGALQEAAANPMQG